MPLPAPPRALPSLLLLLLAFAPIGARTARAEGDAAASPSTSRPADDVITGNGNGGDKAKAPPMDPIEAGQLDELRALEARVSTGQTLHAEEVARVVDRLAHGSSDRVRALAAAVLAWIDPTSAAPALLEGVKDPAATVRATSAQSLLSLARRMNDDAKRDATARALTLLDDTNDEVACAGGELLVGLNASAAADAIRTRANGELPPLRYACFARLAGLPARAVDVPELPKLPDEKKPDDAKPDLPKPLPAPQTPDGTWLFITTAGTAGLLSASLVPSSFAPPRDVLLYARDRSRTTRQEVAFFAQLGAGVLGAAALGGAAYGSSLVLGPLDVDEATAALLFTGSATMAGASLQLVFDMKQGYKNAAMATGAALGALGGGALAYAATLDADDNALALSMMAFGGVAGGLTAFTAVPVNLDDVLGAPRTDFGFGCAALGASVFGMGALGAGAFLDIPARRSFALAAGGLLGSSLLAGTSFLLVPSSIDVKSRIAAGAGLAGELGGAVLAFLFVPDSWVSAGAAPALGTAVQTDGDKVSLGIPALTVLPTADGGALGMTLVRGRF